MDQILDGIGDTIGDIIASDVVQFGGRMIFIYIAILWIATAYWAFRDMQQRSDNAILPYLVAAGIILFTPFFFILAVWVYKIVRPHEKIGEVWERNLAEEALLAEVEAIHHCPTCERRVDEEWIICPSCRTRLNRVCPNCSRLVGLDWSLCAWCGKDFERREIAAAATIEPLPSGLEPTGRIAAPAERLDPGHPGLDPDDRPVARHFARSRAAPPPPGIRCPSVDPARAGLRRNPSNPLTARLPSGSAVPPARAPAPSPSRGAQRPPCSSSAGSPRSSGFGAIFVALLAGGTAGAAILLAVGPGRCCRSGSSPEPARRASSGAPGPTSATRVRRRSSCSRRRSRCRCSRSSSSASRSRSLGVAVDGPVGRLASVARPGGHLRRA